MRTNPALLEPYLLEVRLGTDEVGLVYRDEVLFDVLGPNGRALYWKVLAPVRVETLPLGNGIELPASVKRALAQAPAGSRLAAVAKRDLTAGVVPERHQGLVFVDGEFVRVIGAGTHLFYTPDRHVAVELVDLRMQLMELAGQEVLTRDKVTVRINLSAGYQVEDPVRARTGLAKFADFLYRELQLALRRAVGTRTLDTLLEEKGAVERSVLEAVRPSVAGFGMTLASVGVKDLILPGDMRELLNRVVEAEKVAQANVIKRREETAATRSLANTAKLMDAQPTLMRLKELEALEKVAEKVDRLTVFGGLDGVLKDTVQIGVRSE
jgi:regulator of protease activity HflC (stomatin/prohibitin superfamily)